MPPTVSATSEYDFFAAVYHRHIAKAFYPSAVAALDQLGLGELPAGACLLDLCCGTGEVAASLAARGFRVTGLDVSESMLHFARRRASRVHLVRADVRQIAFASRFDAAVSTFNSLAHVPTCDLPLVFRNVHEALHPGSLFLFDLTTEEGYAAKWRGSFSFVEEQEVCLIRPGFDPAARLAHNRVTLFRRDGHDGWQRRDFDIVQHCHHDSEVSRALAAAGFQRADSFDAERDLGLAGESGRRFFRCYA